MAGATPSVYFQVDAAGPLFMVERLEAALGDVGLTFFLGKEVGPYIIERARRRFANEGDDVVGKWAPLLPATQVIRANNPQWPVGPEHPINKRTGQLEQWVTGSSFVVKPHSLGATMTYPSKSPPPSALNKVRVAQQGGQAPGAKNQTVPRPVLAVNTADLMFVTTRLFFHLQSVGTGKTVI